MTKHVRSALEADPVARKLLLALVATLILGSAWLLIPNSILADGPTVPTDPPMPGLHRHYIVLADGSTEAVGPDWCDNQTDPAIMLAFYHFHYNVHMGAPGLHNELGAEIRGHPGCGPIPASVTP